MIFNCKVFLMLYFINDKIILFFGLLILFCELYSLYNVFCLMYVYCCCLKLLMFLNLVNIGYILFIK